MAKFLLKFNSFVVALEPTHRILFSPPSTSSSQPGFVQLQQIAASEGRTRAETRSLTSSGGEREDGKMAIHSAV